MIIRWLGAFGMRPDLVDSLYHELSLGKEGEPKCAEHIRNGASNMPKWIRIGLLVRNSAVLRKFRTDVYSRLNKQRTAMRVGRPEGEISPYLSHTEAWVRPDYRAIVLRSGGPAISREDLKVIALVAERYALPLLKLDRKGKLIPVRIRKERL